MIINKFALILTLSFFILISICNVNGEEEIIDDAVLNKGNVVIIDLEKVAISYKDAFNGVNLFFNLPDEYTLIDEEKSDDYIKLYILGPEVKAVGREVKQKGYYGAEINDNAIRKYRDNFYIEMKIKSFSPNPPFKALTIKELAEYDRTPWGIIIIDNCGGSFFEEKKFIKISGHDAEYGMTWTYSYAKILTGGDTYISVTYCGSPLADSKGYRYRQITSDNGVEFWANSATINDQTPEDRYSLDIKTIIESIEINDWAFDKTIIVRGEPIIVGNEILKLKYFSTLIKPKSENILNKLKQCGGKILWTKDEISKGEKEFKLKLYKMDIYDGNGELLKSFEVTRESTRCQWPLSDTIDKDDPYGTNAIAPPGKYYGRLDENHDYKRVILSDKKGKRELESEKKTTRGGIQIHGVYAEMGNGTWGCMGVPENKYNSFINLFKKEDTIWVKLLRPSFNISTESQTGTTKVSVESIEWNNKGDVFYISGNYENAITEYDKAIEIDKMNYVAWHSKGSAYYQLGKYEEAVESYSRALKINPNDMEAWYGKGVSLYELGRYSEAIESFDEALKINPENKKAIESRKNVLELMKNHVSGGFEVILAIVGLVAMAYLLRIRV